MSYKIAPHELPGVAVKRIANEECAKALSALEADKEPLKGVHAARKSLKKLRGLVRLVRFEIGDEVYRQENATFRDAGRKISSIRDRFSLLETLEALQQEFNEQLYRKVFTDAEKNLKAELNKLKTDSGDARDRIEETRTMILMAQERIEDWPIRKKASFDALEPGLKKIYRQGRQQYSLALGEPAAENFHNWRKRVKYLWYQIRLLREATWQPVMKKLANEMHQLAGFLGDDHDLVTFQKAIENGKIVFKDDKSRQLLQALLVRKSAELRNNAVEPAMKIYADKPKHFTRRIDAWWRAKHNCPRPFSAGIDTASNQVAAAQAG